MTYVPEKLRNLVFERASGRCEYCLIPDGWFFARHQIDHIIAEKHGGQTFEENLALCCSLCNRFKGSDITTVDSKTGAIIPLFNPRLDKWEEHLLIDKELFIGLSEKGRGTIQLLRLNHPMRVEQRKD